MPRITAIFLLGFLMLGLPACSDDEARDNAPKAAPAQQASYHATLADGVNFARAGLPDFLTSVTGLSTMESWGRWSDAGLAPEVTFTFKQPLPKKFTVVLSAICTKENENLPIKVRAGAVEQTITLSRTDVQRHEISFTLAEPTTTLVFTPAKTSSPQELGIGPDVRHLGIGFAKLSIETK